MGEECLSFAAIPGRNSMLIRPHTLALITTYQCTAACDHCCFACTPKVTKALPFERMEALIDEAAEMPSLRVVVFTGGECFLLGEQLDRLIARASAKGLITRCVTNGYWATSRRVAEVRVVRAISAGLKEINFSTGTFHARYVPAERIVNGALASIEAHLTTLINIEIFNESSFDVDGIIKHPEIAHLIEKRRLKVQRNFWIENGGSAELSHAPEHSRFIEGQKSGCSTVLNALAVTPDQSLVSCCGLHLEKMPDLHLGSVADSTLADLIRREPDELLKIWIHVEGPERILEFVKKHDPDYALPMHSVHPCETCLHLYSDKRSFFLLYRDYREVEDEVIATYLASLAAKVLGDTIESVGNSAAD